MTIKNQTIINIRGFRFPIDIEQQPSGQYFITSPVVTGLLLAEQSLDGAVDRACLSILTLMKLIVDDECKPAKSAEPTPQQADTGGGS
jgi:hypothetical protein